VLRLKGAAKGDGLQAGMGFFIRLLLILTYQKALQALWVKSLF
jgi:hypothetical protein